MGPPAVRVLVVDDNPGDARLVEWSLAHEPDGTFECARAGRVAEALALLDRRPADAVLLDLGLPDSTGADGVRRIRSRAPETAVVVLTGSDDPRRVREALAAGAQDYQVKGVFPRGHLSRVLRAAIACQRVESAIGRGDLPDPERWEAHVGGEALALFADGRSPLVSEAWVRITGVPRDGSAEHRARLAGLLAAGPVGETEVESPGQGRRTVEYVVRTFGEGGAVRRLVRLRAPPSAPAPSSGRGAPDGEAVLDAAAWDQLRELAGADPSFLPAVIDAFLEEGSALLAELRAAASAGDRGGVERAAHRLKSACAQVGALDLARRLGRLERESAGPAEGDLGPEIAEIAGGFPAVVAALKLRRPVQ